MIALDLALIDEVIDDDILTKGSRDVRRVTTNFERFCKTAFDHGNMFSGMPLVSKPRYRTGQLENALKQIYTHDHLFGGSPRRATSQPKVAVTCSLDTGKSIILSNYSRANLEDGRKLPMPLKHHHLRRVNCDYFL